MSTACVDLKAMDSHGKSDPFVEVLAHSSLWLAIFAQRQTDNKKHHLLCLSLGHSFAGVIALCVGVCSQVRIMPPDQDKTKRRRSVMVAVKEAFTKAKPLVCVTSN